MEKFYRESAFIYSNNSYCRARGYEEIDEAFVREELGLPQKAEHESQNDEHDGLVRFILESARRIFLTVLSLDKDVDDNLKYMEVVYRKQYTNVMLPFTPQMQAELGLKPRSQLNFDKNQWQHLAPTFSTDSFLMRLDLRQPLPFTKMEKKQGKDGATCEVYRVEVDPDHMDFEKDVGTVVAIKSMRASTDDPYNDFRNQFDNEAHILQATRDLHHDHMIKWLASYSRGTSEYSFMFPWAEGGTLREYWGYKDMTGCTSNNIHRHIVASLQQFRGMADALAQLHNKNIRHGDVKPENTLVYPALGSVTGTWVIADFGLSKQHNSNTSERGPTGTRRSSFQYESPDAMHALTKGGKYSRLSDLWSLGCIITEHLVWLLYGHSELLRFGSGLSDPSSKDSSPSFFGRHSNSKNAFLKGSVAMWIVHMLDDSRCAPGTALRKLLDFVKDHLLVMGSRWNWGQRLPGQPQPLPEQPPQPGQPDRLHRQTTLLGPGLLPDVLELGKRAAAWELRRKLDEILLTENSDDFFCAEGWRDQRKGPDTSAASQWEPSRDDFLHPDTALYRPPSRPPQASAIPLDTNVVPTNGAQVQQEFSAKKMNKSWTFSIDDELASTLQNREGDEALYPPSLPPKAPLCSQCEKLEFGTRGFYVTYTLDHLQCESTHCDVCKLFWKACQDSHATSATEVQFEMELSALKMADATRPFISILKSPNFDSFTRLQRGFPQLPESGSPMHFEVIRQWLESCDKNHPKCNYNRSSKTWLPTRLIDVNQANPSMVRLVETKGRLYTGTTSPYVVLSHPWGPRPHFSTVPDDANDPTLANTLTRHKMGIKIADLPLTFQDAITVTKALGKQYIWIDAICIVQGDGGDFKDESSKMADVFSSAYCSIAASWANCQRDGFLKTSPGQEKEAAKRNREVVTFQPPGKEPLYLCEMIDDFETDVLEGGLNQRGWVLQERALARRTIYFTERQTYMECGSGVRCETMAKMDNKLAAFLGDPAFPSLALDCTRGEQIRWYQDLYAQYSRLGLSQPEDRPIAIRGLESRLISTFRDKHDGPFNGGYGVLYDGLSGGLFHRSLLWRRGHDVGSLERISFHDGHGVPPPSWSWMAYKGGIDFFFIEGETAIWEDKRLVSPWSRRRGSDNVTKELDGKNTAVIVARAYVYEVELEQDGAVPTLITDVPGASVDNETRCVIVGTEIKQPEQDDNNRMCYILIVRPASGHWRPTVVGYPNYRAYKRIGAGSIPKRCISEGDEGENILII